MEISLPHLFKPRSYQTPFLGAWDIGRGTLEEPKPYKRLMMVAHRRMGKDKMVFANLAKKMMERKGTYFYFLPTYNQARKIIWNGADKNGFRFLDHFPKEIVKKKNESEMIIELTNGSILQMVGADNIDRIVGTNPIGVVFSEYSLMKPEVWRLISPILAENGGWAVFIFTPRGKNHAYELLSKAQKNDNWYVEILPVTKTRALSEDVLLEEKMNMTDEYFQQEYMCFPKGTDIITREGVKDISEIEVNDYVLTHANRYRRVVTKFKHEYSGDLVNLKYFGNNQVLQCTPNHPIRTTDDGVTYRWKNSNDFKKDDFVTIPKPLLKKNKIISDDLAKIIAWYIAEGSFSGNQVAFSLNDNEKEYQDEIINALDHKVNLYSNNGCTQIIVNNVELGEFLSKHCGNGAINKSIPFELIAGHEDLVYETLMKGDGCDMKRNRNLYSTVSKTLAYQVQILANSLGYTGSFSLAKGKRQEVIEGRTVNCNPTYVVRINKSGKRMKYNLGKYKGGELKMKPRKYSVTSRIIEKSYSPHNDYVYNFEVETDNSYVANSIVVHNCSFTDNATAVFKDVHSRTYPLHEYEFNDFGKYQIGVDLAKSQDYTVITPFDLTTFKVGPQDSFNQIDYTLQKTKIEAAFLRHNKGRVVMDATGVGVPIVDDLVNKGINIAPYTFTFNSRNELLVNLQILLEQDKIKIPDDPELLEQLEAAVWEITPAGRSKIIVPEPMHDDCFCAGTKILTDKGQMNIEDIKVGDLVMTRKGYKEVIHTKNKIKPVISRFGLEGTVNHPIITSNGEVPLASVKESDTLYIWKDKQLNIEEKNIIDTQTQKEDNLVSIFGDMINGKNHLLRCIGKSGLIIMEKYRKVSLSITKMITHLIMKLETWSAYLKKNTRIVIWKIQIIKERWLNLGNDNQKGLLKLYINGEKKIQNWHMQYIKEMERKITGEQHLESGEKKIQKKQEKSALLMERKLTIQNILKSGVLKELGILLKLIVFGVVKNLLILLIMLLNTVVLFVSLGTLKRKRVYNIQVQGQPEYFANNILVHNCLMSLALAVWDIPTRPILKEGIYRQLENEGSGIKPMYPSWGL